MQRPSYRDFYYPLNVFLHMLTLEGERVSDLHYGLFQETSDSFTKAQTRSTDLLMENLPPPPARLLDVGSGLGTTLARLVRAGYDAVGLNPDAEQVAALRALHGDRHLVHIGRFEELDPAEREADRYDAVLFQESSQYIDSTALFSKAAAITWKVVVLDEFAVEPLTHEGALHDLPGFLGAAESQRFRLTRDLDVSSQALPTVDYFLYRFSRHRQALIADLGLTSQQVDDLVASGERYKSFYESGTYQYRLLVFER